MNYDQWLAALCLWREARGETMATKNAIWHVIQNRAADEQRRWPRTISGVIQQHHQFSSMSFAGDPNLVAWPVEPIPGQQGSDDWKAYLDCQTVVESPLNADPTNGANAYESLVPGVGRPSWASTQALVLEIGNTRFYRL